MSQRKRSCRVSVSVPKLKTVRYGVGQRPKSALVPLTTGYNIASAARLNNRSVTGSSLTTENEQQQSAVTVNSEKSRYYERKSEDKKKWKNVLDKLITLKMSMEHPSTSTCTICHTVCEEIIRCNDCGPHTYMCNVCEETRHDNVLHKPQVFQVNARMLLLLLFIISVKPPVMLV